MKKIAIISSSVRDGRLSHRVALYIDRYVRSKEGFETDLLDLRKYDFPLFHERLSFMTEPSSDVVHFAETIRDADGVIVVSPVYNGSFPASLKNVIDLLYAEWKHKPVLVASVTYGNVPPIATAQQLQTIFLKLGSYVAPVLFTFTNAGTQFDEEGNAVDEKYSAGFTERPLQEFFMLL